MIKLHDSGLYAEPIFVSGICVYRVVYWGNMEQQIKNRKLWPAIFFLSIFLGIELLYSLLSYSNKAKELPSIVIQDNGTHNSRTVTVENPKCSDVSNGMMRGRWKSRPLTPKEKTEIEAYMTSARDLHHIPRSMQRKDGKCGTVNYPKLYWFRALCNPKGPTPCCFRDKCVAKSPDECRCTDCYDLRIPIHAEYSTWIPEDPKCQVKNYTSSDACQLLNKTHLIMVGDSIMHQLYVALLLTLANNKEDRVYRSDIPNVPKEIPDRCKGMYTYVDKWCRLNILNDARVCKKSVPVTFFPYLSLRHTREFHNLIKSLLHVKNTVLFVGTGFHDSFNLKVYHEFILPVILMMKSQKAVWPRIIWATNQKLGLLKTPLRPNQENKNIQMFNNFLSEHLRKYKIPIFDTWNMTSDVMSQDGSHYGIGVNLLKAQMFLSFLEELKSKKSW